MATVPIEIFQLDASGEARYKVTSGRIEGQLKAALDITAEACHGIALGIEPGIFGELSAQGQALLVGGSAQGQLAARAGAKVMLRVNPNPFETLGLTVEAGAYAFAAAAGRLGVYLTPEYFSRFIQEHLDELPADLFLIFLEEVRAEAGVWGKIAAAAAAEGHLNTILSLEGDDPGFEISAGFNVGFGAGTGWDFYCKAGFTDLRRAIQRSCLRINLEVTREIGKQPTPVALALTRAFDFTFPFVVMTAYDLGVVAHEKGALLNEQDIAEVLKQNFTKNLQRFTADSIAEGAIRWLANELRKLQAALAGKTLPAVAVIQLEVRAEELINLLETAELSADMLNRAVAAAVDIVDLFDDHLTQIYRPLTVFWLASMLGLRARQVPDNVGGGVGASSSFVGSAEATISLDVLSDPPQLVTEEIQTTLGRPVSNIDIGSAVDYLIEIGVSPLLAKYSPEFNDFRQKLEASFGLSDGDIIEDIVRSIGDSGTLANLNSYTALKQFVRDELLRDAIRNRLLPQVRQRASDNANAALTLYLDEVVDPSTALVSEFLFSKLDEVQLAGADTFNESALRTLAQNITAGCGIVVFQVLARNLVYFDRVVTDFMLDNIHAGFNEMRVAFATPQHPFLQRCQEALEMSLPGNPDLSRHSNALQALLFDLADAYGEVTGPTILTPERRNRIYELKRDILLSIAGDLDNDATDFMGAIVEHVLDCAHIPNLEKSKELATLLLEIQVDSLRVMLERAAPALAEFYLAITLHDFVALRQQLNTWLQTLRQAAEQALAAYSELADRIRTEITAVLDEIDASLSRLRRNLEQHIQGNWATQAKIAVRMHAETILTEGIADPALREVAITTFAATQWLIINPILDVASDALATAVMPLIASLDDFVDNATDATAAFLAWQAAIEDQLIHNLQNMVVIPAAETAEIILDTLFPPYVLSMIEEYLEKRARERRLRQEEVLQNQALALLASDRDAKQAQRQQHAHRHALDLSIAIPAADASRVYPASLRFSVFVTGLTDEILAEPQSARIQFRLNGRPLPENRSQWQALPTGGHLWTWQSADGNELVQGLNIFEASWVRGADSTQTERAISQFLVDATAFYAEQDFTITIDADPPGADIDTESVLIEWAGSSPLQLDGWMLRDLAGHRYMFPQGIILTAGQSLRVFTGRDPAQDDIAPSNNNKTVHMGRRKAVWNNDGDLLELINANGVVVISQGYGNYYQREV